MERVQHCCHCPQEWPPCKVDYKSQRRMLSDVKKNPRVSAKDFQKSLVHATISPDKSTIQKTLRRMEIMGGPHGGRQCRPKKTKQNQKKKSLLHLWSLQKSTWMFHSTTGKIFCGQMKPKLSCLEGTHNTMCGEKKGTTHQHQNLNCEVWWREHHGLGLFRFLGACTDCYYRRKKWNLKFIETFYKES